MPLEFPTDPDVDQTYTFMGRTWVWNGVGWAYRPSAYRLSRILPLTPGFLVYRNASGVEVFSTAPTGATYL